MEDLIRLYNIYSPSTKTQQMREYLTNWLTEHNVTFQTDGVNIWRNNGGICFCAHMDQVHTNGQAVHFYKTEDIISGYNEKMQQTSLGADDKNGIWLIMQLIKKGLDCSFIISDGEEVGLVGANQMSKDVLSCMDCFIQLDRKGTTDVCISGSTGKYCSSFGYYIADLLDLETCTGISSDIDVYKSYAPSCNVSVGYDNAHTCREVTDWKYLSGLVDKLVMLPGALLHHEYENPKRYKTILNRQYGRYHYPTFFDDEGGKDKSYRDLWRR